MLGAFLYLDMKTTRVFRILALKSGFKPHVSNVGFIWSFALLCMAFRTMRSEYFVLSNASGSAVHSSIIWRMARGARSMSQSLTSLPLAHILIEMLDRNETAWQ